MIFFNGRQDIRLFILVALFFTGSMAYSSEEPLLPRGLSSSQSEESPPILPNGLKLKVDNSGKDERIPLLPLGLENSQPVDASIPNVNFLKEPWLDITSLWEVRNGYRLQNDEYEEDASIGETRLQLEMEKLWRGFAFSVTTDIFYDWVFEKHTVDMEEGEGFLDLREANIAYSPLDFMDVKLGRQVLTWGTGDLVFINDLFPKDWKAFFIGRDTEYLKAPSDAIKTSFYTELLNLDVVYTPEFDSDRFVTGDRLSYWNGNRIAGRDSKIHPDRPDDSFEDDELALRISKNIGGYELAGYGYWGYWKTPTGFDILTGRYTFPRLNVYGASARGQIGKGIGNVEFGFYDSREDLSGDDPYISNSQMRYLIGYEQDLPAIATDLTVGVQYYVEQMLGYGNYRRALIAGSTAADEYRHLLTFRITKLYWNQNLTCSLFTYLSPSDEDVYLRPNINYKVNDNIAIEVGANVFFGNYPHTFFGQFEDNTNIYTGMRYNF